MKRKILKICSIIIICMCLSTIITLAVVQSTTHYQIDEGKKFITRIIPKTSVEEFKKKFNIDSSNINIKNADDKSNVKTAMKSVFKDGRDQKEYTLSVIDDVNDDGNGDKSDTELMADHIVENIKLGEIEQKSADVNGDNTVNQIDLFASVRYITDGELYIPEIKRPASPTITVTEGKLGKNEYYKTDVKVLIKKAENSEVGIQKTIYKIGEDDTEHEIGDEYTITLTENKIYSVYAYSYSQDGTKSQIARKTIKISKSGETGATSKVAPSLVSKDESSITIKLEQRDTVSKIVSAQCRIREKGGNWSKWQDSQTFTGLKPDTIYEIQTRVTNEAGQTTESDLLTVTTDSFPIPEITVEKADEWAKSKKVTIKGKSGYSLYVAVGDESATKQNTTDAILTITKNTEVSAYLVDSKGTRGDTATAIIEKIDDADPTITGVLCTKSSNTIKIESRINDKNIDETNGSGIASVVYNIKKHGTSAWEQTKTYNNAQTYHTFTGLVVDKKYDIQIIAQDRVGRKTIYNGEATTNEISSIALEVENAGVWKTEKLVSVTGEIYETHYIEMSQDAWNTSERANYITAKLNNQRIYARVKDNDGNVQDSKSITVTKVDDMEPTISGIFATKSTSDITVNSSIKDTNKDGSNGSGIQSVVYRIKKSSDNNYDTKQTKTYNTVQNSHTFTGLEADQNYDIQITAKDKVGRVTNQTLKVSTNDVVNISIEVEDANVWRKQKTVFVKGEINRTDHIQMRLNGESEWGEKSSLTVNKNNRIVYARVVDTNGNEKYADEVTVKMIDDKNPVISGIRADKDLTENSLLINATIKDENIDNSEGSGIASVTYKIRKAGATSYDTTKTMVYERLPYSSHLFTDLERNATYQIEITAKDNVGRTTSNDTTEIVMNDRCVLKLDVEKPEEWTLKKRVEAVSEKPRNYIIEMMQYEIVDGTENPNVLMDWTKTTNVTVSKNGVKVKARIKDSETGGEVKAEAEVTVNYIDNTDPTKDAPTNNEDENTPTSLSINFNQTDNESGIPDDEMHRFVKVNDREWEKFLGNKFKVYGLEPGTKYTITTKAIDRVGHESISDSAEFSTSYAIRYVINGHKEGHVSYSGPEGAYPGRRVTITENLVSDWTDPNIKYDNGVPNDTNKKGKAIETTQEYTVSHHYTASFNTFLEHGTVKTAISNTLVGNKTIEFDMPEPEGGEVNVYINISDAETKNMGKIWYWGKRRTRVENKLNSLSFQSILLSPNPNPNPNTDYTIRNISGEIFPGESYNEEKVITDPATGVNVTHKATISIRKVNNSAGVKPMISASGYLIVERDGLITPPEQLVLQFKGIKWDFMSGSYNRNNLYVYLTRDSENPTFIEDGKVWYAYRGTKTDPNIWPTYYGEGTKGVWNWGTDVPEPLYNLTLAKDANISSLRLAEPDNPYLAGEEIPIITFGNGSYSDNNFIYEDSNTNADASTVGKGRWKYNYSYKLEAGSRVLDEKTIENNSAKLRQNFTIYMPASDATLRVRADKINTEIVKSYSYETPKYTTDARGHYFDVMFKFVADKGKDWETDAYTFYVKDDGSIITPGMGPVSESTYPELPLWPHSRWFEGVGLYQWASDYRTIEPWVIKPEGASNKYIFGFWFDRYYYNERVSSGIDIVRKDEKNLPAGRYYISWREHIHDSDTQNGFETFDVYHDGKSKVVTFEDIDGSILKFNDGTITETSYRWEAE